MLAPEKVKFPVTFLYGGGSDWMNADYGHQVVHQLQTKRYAALRLVPLAGHQVFMDNPTEFNRVLIEAVLECDKSLSAKRFGAFK